VGDFGIVVLYILGMALMITEVFMPGAVMGIVGLVFALGSIVIAFSQESQTLGFVLIGITAVSIPLMVFVWLGVLKRLMAIKMTQQGYTSAMVHLKELIGQEGVAITMLRPSGMARFGDRKVDVVAESEVIDKDTRIKVVEVESNRVVVRAVQK